jgi:hypothetical protein
MAEGGDDYAKRTARIKNLLSSYYGEGGGPGSSQPESPAVAAAAAGASPRLGGPAGGPPAGGAHQPGGSPSRSRAGGPGAALSMDSPAFNADHHLQQLLRGLPLDRLLAEHRGMAREIKNLDSDMQQLVYENYNKFITATGEGGGGVDWGCLGWVRRSKGAGGLQGGWAAQDG